MKKSLVAALLCVSGVAEAAQWTGYFAITGTYISGAENLHYRVAGTLPLPAPCPAAPTYAYINQSASGAKAYIAALMTAQVAGKLVKLYADNESGYCRIVEMQVQTN
jgi:hypothetical protein